jgi:site-specific DNA-methyltransferase (cytosine-N4-specific)
MIDLLISDSKTNPGEGRATGPPWARAAQPAAAEPLDANMEKNTANRGSHGIQDDSHQGYRTKLGVMHCGKAEHVLASPRFQRYRGQVQLVLTSPPFPLNRKKKYGNLQGEEYIRWLSSFGTLLREFLRPDGSIVIEVGNGWEPGHPTMSTLAIRSLLGFLDAGSLLLCQQFVSHNPARLPSPAQWVNVERIRVKDSFTHIWWMSPTDRPKADNRRILTPYSDSMQKLLKTGKYNAGPRPSQHRIGKKSFLTDNEGSIPPNVISVSNTNSLDPYQKYCRNNRLTIHPARMASEIAEFFIKFLTEPGDLVLDPFAGSNTTGSVSEKLGRKWIAIEPNSEYIRSSMGRFDHFN